MTATMLRGVVFDLDGVIVDSHPIHKQAWRAFLASVGKQVSESDLDFIFEGRRRREILVHFLGPLSHSEIEEHGKRKDVFFQKACAALEGVPGSLEIIKEIEKAGLSIALATSASRDRARWTLQQLQISQYFRIVITGDDVVASKPDPTIYRLAAEGLAISPDCLVAVEDSICGVRAAKSAGLRCVAIAVAEDARSLISAGADRVFPDLASVSIGELQRTFQIDLRSDCSGLVEGSSQPAQVDRF
jgi:HAD superfamily hydrolase (TIGR01509 family)